MRRYHILDGDKTTVDGTVSTNFTNNTVNGRGFAREGDDVYCPECDSVGKIILDGPHLYDDIWGRQAAVENDLCGCKCDPRPRLISSQTIRCQVTEDSSAPRARAAAQPATTTPPAANPAPPPRRAPLLLHPFLTLAQGWFAKTYGAAISNKPKPSSHPAEYSLPIPRHATAQSMQHMPGFGWKTIASNGRGWRRLLPSRWVVDFCMRRTPSRTSRPKKKRGDD